MIRKSRYQSIILKRFFVNKNKYSFRGYFMRDNFEKGILETVKNEIKEITGIEIDYQAYKNEPKDWIYQFSLKN